MGISTIRRPVICSPQFTLHFHDYQIKKGRRARYTAYIEEKEMCTEFWFGKPKVNKPPGIPRPKWRKMLQWIFVENALKVSISLSWHRIG
jgi:hypothetical protein